MYVLSFDLSSTTVGYSIFNIETQELKKIDYIKYPDECLDLLDKGFYLQKVIQTILSENENITEFIIEERLKKFQSGLSSIDNLLTLAQLNYICQYLMKFNFNFKITEINVLKARGLIFPEIFKITKAEKIKQKDYVFKKVLSILDNSLFPKKILKSGPNKGLEVFLEEAKDMADSWLVGQAFFKLQHESSNKSTTVRKNKKNSKSKK